ncbi:MarR family winged helix-turn-helix transcriptional regulator [Kushneria sp. Sum13]|uniref:MarR family winged helix-turn-helix transcriptional regulator n=1 Tax=Kushneria sp. Sum13 TaxID=3459196 RepID=UPI00404573EF
MTTISDAHPDAAPDNSPRREGSPRVPYLIGRLDRALRKHIGEAVRPLGLTMQQYTALSVLARRSPLSNAQLADRSLVSPQAANEMVRLMEQRGLVMRSPDPHHGRIIHISMTDEGKRLLAECDRAAGALEACMMESLDDQQRVVLERCLRESLKALGAGLIDTE